MKLKLLTLGLLLFGKVIFAQAYLEEIGNKTCACVGNIPEVSSREELNIELALCIMESSKGYQSEIKKDFNIDIASMDKGGTELGRIIGKKMALICPKKLLGLVKKINTNPSPQPSPKLQENTSKTAQGKIVAISNDKFVTFSIKDKRGKISKYLWLTFISSDLDLSLNYKELQGKSIEFSFTTQEFFDPKIEEYRSFKILDKLSVLPN